MKTSTPQVAFPRSFDAAPERAAFPDDFDAMKLRVDPAVMNRGITPEFSIQRIEREPLIDEDGKPGEPREPLEFEVVRLRTAGDNCSEPVLPVTDEIRSRFSMQYNAWKNDGEAIAAASRRATSLKGWSEMQPELAADLERLNIFSVEDLAYLSDSAVSKFPHGRMWRDRALSFLAAANEDARFSELKDENAALREQLGQVMAEAQKTQALMRSLLGETNLNGSKAS
jgi:hypothetical protein